MRNTRNAFTLVELIVVITILAILGTIAFIYLQGYSADARNSKRTEDLNSIVKSIEIKVSNGSNLLSFVTAGDEVGAFSVAGADVIAGTNYQAGIPNYSAVGIKSTDFTDPSDASDYRIGLTTKKDGEYEIAATMENGSGDKSALIVGTYSPRTQDVLTGATIPFAGTKIVLQDADINKIKRWDVIFADGTTATLTGTVTVVSRDGKTLTVDQTLTWSTISLAATETLGLIEDKDESGTPVTNDSTANLPY